MTVVLALKDFQCHKKTRLEFEPGLTVINGSNSSGKSSLLRAVKALVLNSPYAKKFIRRGAGSVVVALQLDELPAIYWQRDDKSAAYKVGKDTYTKVGKSKLFDILPEFPLVRDESGALLNIQDEWSILFPFDRSPTDLFKLFEDMFSQIPTGFVIDEIRGDELEIRRKIAEAQATIATLRFKRSLIEATASEIDYEKLERAQKKLSVLFGELDDLGQDCKNALSAEAYSSLAIMEAPSLEPLEEFVHLTDTLHRALTLNGIATIDMDTKGVNIDGVGEVLDLSDDCRNAIIYSLVADVKFKKPPVLDEVEEYLSIVESGEKAFTLSEEIKAEETALVSLINKEKEIKTKLNKFKTCPLCERAF